MTLPRPRFTIRSLMIATAAVAGLLAIPAEWRVAAAFFAIPLLSPLAAWWLVRRGHRRFAAVSFWVPAITANVLFAAACLSPAGMLSILLFVVSFFTLLPMLLSFGIAWATLEMRTKPSERVPSWPVGIAVLLLSAMPLATSLTFWPLQLAFLAARPDLERVAKQVESGVPVIYPQRAGMYLLRGSRVDPATGNIALLTDTDPSGPAGFVRNRSGRPGPYGCFSPIRGDAEHVGLWDGWCYHVED